METVVAARMSTVSVVEGFRSTRETVIVSDTIPLRGPAAACDKIQTVSVATLFGEAIRAIHHNDSVSRLFA